MLISYQAKVKGTELVWIGKKPDLHDVDVIVTVLPKITSTGTAPPKKRTAPEKLQGMAKIHGDIINVPEMTAEWGLE